MQKYFRSRKMQRISFFFFKVASTDQARNANETKGKEGQKTVSKQGMF